MQRDEPKRVKRNPWKPALPTTQLSLLHGDRGIDAMRAWKMFEVAFAGMLRTQRSDGSASLHHRLSKSAAPLLIVARLSESSIHGAERRVTQGAPRLGESCDTIQMRLQPNSDTSRTLLSVSQSAYLFLPGDCEDRWVIANNNKSNCHSAQREFLLPSSQECRRADKESWHSKQH